MTDIHLWIAPAMQQALTIEEDDAQDTTQLRQRVFSLLHLSDQYGIYAAGLLVRDGKPLSYYTTLCGTNWVLVDHQPPVLAVEAAPMGRVKGINLVINCPCTTAVQSIPVGYGHVDVYDIPTIPCPTCASHNYTVASVGLADCAYRVHTTQRDTDLHAITPWKCESVYETIELDEGAKYSHVMVLARPIGSLDTCMICIKDIKSDELVLGCSHTFHKACFKAWNRHLCPVCEAPSK
jgi:hypothetical protein